tara:strand:+ start:189 stop:563 length:375 start_codon:yes stop_codon:yes gene_type:complete
MKFVVNTCYGGFGLSDAAIDRLIELGLQPAVERISGETDDNYRYRAYVSPFSNGDRFHPLLVQVVEELGKVASGDCSQLQIAEFKPEYLLDKLVEEHDGYETVQWPAQLLYDDDDDEYDDPKGS